MSKFTLLITLLISVTCFAQENYNSESYNVSLGDIESKTFTKDSTANAIVIYEQGKSYVDKEEYNLKTEIKKKIKILKKEGFNNANVVISLYKNKSNKIKAKNIIAITHNTENGKVVKTQLLEKDIYIEEVDENHDLVKFTLPNIKEGSIITYSYMLISPYVSSYKGWYFQDDIPKLYSEYNASIPGNWLFHTKLIGGKKLTTNTSVIKKNCLIMGNGATADCSENVYIMKDVPAFIEEEYMTTKHNYLARIEYDLETFRDTDGTIKHYTKTWEDVDREFKTDKEIGKQLKKSINIEELLSSAIINDTDKLSQAKSIYNYVQNNYTWNGDYKIYRDVSIKNLLSEKSGNVSSINILLHNLLRESGIDVKPVLLSTRNNGFPTTIFPVIYDFNYLLVQATINDKTYLLDATDSYLNFGEIPFRCLNQFGRLLDFKKGSDWIDIKPSAPSNILYQANLKFNEDDQLVGNIKSKRTGYPALYKKKDYYSNSDDYLDQLENSFPYLEISNFEITSDKKTSKDFKESYDIEYTFDEAGNNIYLNPFFVKFFKENPFKLQERTYPIDFGYSDTFFYMFKIELNDNYQIVELPKPQNITLPNKTGQILFNVSQIGNTINLSLKFNFKNAIYDADYYPYLKEFMSKIVDIQNNSIILLKRNK